MPPHRVNGRGLTNRKGEKAAERIRETRPSEAGAGLQGDWEWTGGAIWGGEAPVPRDDTYTYLASTWAVPELRLDGILEPCWRWEGESPGWDAETYWPPEAIAKLAARTHPT